MSMTEDERMIDKVIKLLAKAESTTPEEAEALMAKAQEIMTRHAIDTAMLAAARGEREPDVIIEHQIKFTGIYSKAHRALAFALATGNQFRSLQSNRSGTLCFAYWVGFKSEIEAAEVLLTSLLIQAEKFQRDFMKEWVADSPHASAFEKFVARRSFLEGFASGIGTRLVVARKAAEAAAAEHYDEAAATSDDNDDNVTTSTSVALILASRQDQINEWYDKKYGKLRSGRSTRTRSNFSAGDAGRSAAGRANLGQPGVGGTRGALGK